MSSSYGAYVPLQRETLKRTKPKKRHGDWKPETDHTENDEEQAFLNKDASSRVANPRAIDPTNVLSPLPLPFPNQPGPTLEPPQIPIQTSAPVTFYPPPPDPHVSAAVMYVTIAALITTIIFAALWSARGCLEKATVQESEVIRRRTRAGLRNEVVPPNERHRRGGLHSSITFPLPSMHIYSHRHGPRATEYIPFRFQRERNEEVFEGGITDDSASRSHRPNIEDSMDRIAWMNAMIGTKNVVVNPDGSKIATCGVETLEGCNKLADRNSTGSQSDVFDYPCPICLGDFEQGQSVRQLLCRHVYHQPCLDPWILYWQPVCPLCKRSVYDVTPLPLPATVTTTRVSQERQSVESM